MHSDDIAVALAELAKTYDDVPPIDVALLRERLYAPVRLARRPAPTGSTSRSDWLVGANEPI